MTWSPWETIPEPQFASFPTGRLALTSWGGTRLDLFALYGPGLEVDLWHTWTTSGQGGWAAWEKLGRPVGHFLGTQLAAVARPGGTEILDCVVTGPDLQHLWHTWYDPAAGGWGEASSDHWEDLGAPPRIDGSVGLESAPGIASWGPTHLDCFARGSDNGLWHRRYDGAWHGWEPLGHPPDVALDKQLWLRDERHGSWAPWQRLGAPAPGPSIEPVSLTAGTAATFGGPTVFSAFVLDADGRMWEKWHDAHHGWGPAATANWRSYGPMHGLPAAVSPGGSRVDLVVRGGHGELLHRYRS